MSDRAEHQHDFEVFVAGFIVEPTIERIGPDAWKAFTVAQRMAALVLATLAAVSGWPPRWAADTMHVLAVVREAFRQGLAA